jgi:NAD(P)-dependent dehydrogenase (short-subunit alcohol dehydrogenase family)
MAGPHFVLGLAIFGRENPMFQPGLLKGKKALVTGGGTGLGKSLAKRFLELGAEVVICGRREEVLKATAEELGKATGGKIGTHACDVRDAAAIDKMMDAIWPIDVLINNAAGNFVARSEMLSPRAVDAVLNIVLHGTLYCTLAAGKRWIAEKRKGVVLSMTTTAAQGGRAYTMPSATAKAGIVAMTKSVAVEWGPKGVRVVGVAPGLFPTKDAWENLYPGYPPEEQLKEVPLRRYGDHSELANFCSFIVSDMGAYINGENYNFDGGRYAADNSGPWARIQQGWSDQQWEALRKR